MEKWIAIQKKIGPDLVILPGFRGNWEEPGFYLHVNGNPRTAAAWTITPYGKLRSFIPFREEHAYCRAVETVIREHLHALQAKEAA